MTGLWRFRELYTYAFTELADGWGPGEWLDRHPGLAFELAQYGRPGAERRRVADEESWGLYALSRITDVLIAPYQPVNDDPALLSWTWKGKPWLHGPAAGRQAWPELIEYVGAARIAEDRFPPFFHEIVGVEPAKDPDAPPELVEEVWPGALVGSLLLVRAGVRITAVAHLMDPEVAARSRLNWAWYRRNRQASDLSHGWGSNSQWATEFAEPRSPAGRDASTWPG